MLYYSSLRMRRLGILIVVATFYNYLYFSFMKVFKLSVKEGQKFQNRLKDKKSESLREKLAWSIPYFRTYFGGCLDSAFRPNP